MPRIHGGTPATAVRSGSRPAPPDSRYLADQKGSGRPLRYRIQAMGITQSQVTKNTRPAALCVGAVPSLFGPSGADRREVQDGCQNGQLWLGVPLVRFDHILFEYNGKLLRATSHEPRTTAIATSRGLLEAMSSF